MFVEMTICRLGWT